jgi:HSP20 family molecular chaperone IbpA
LKRKLKNTTDLFDVVSIVSTTIVALVLIVLFKVKAGILGIGLGAIAVVTLIYWLKEAKKLLREEEDYRRVKRTIETKEAEWFYDLTDDGDSMTLTAEVPGPAEQVNVRLHDGILEIRVGTKFTRRVQVSQRVTIQDRSYINGVLRVRLKKLNSQVP